jgi:predicted acylesterase/phospholipase RssA
MTCSGHGFNQGIRDAFGERRIEDTWLPFFCITTDISESKMKVHRFGSLVCNVALREGGRGIGIQQKQHIQISM